MQYRWCKKYLNEEGFYEYEYSELIEENSIEEEFLISLGWKKINKPFQMNIQDDNYINEKLEKN